MQECTIFVGTKHLELESDLDYIGFMYSALLVLRVEGFRVVTPIKYLQTKPPQKGNATGAARMALSACTQLSSSMDARVLPGSRLNGAAAHPFHTRRNLSE